MSHQGQPVVTAGAALEGATSALVLIHGRGASAQNILGLGLEVAGPTMALLAPQASGGAWYPRSFLAPLEDNEPFLSSAIEAVLEVVARVEDAGIPRDRIVLGGFSQGACLALEVAARSGGPWSGVFALSGGLIGTGPGLEDAPELIGMGGRYTDKSFDYPSLEDVPVFLGCSDVDPHIPLARLERSAAVLEDAGARVEARIYPGFGHSVNSDELEAVRAMLVPLG